MATINWQDFRKQSFRTSSTIGPWETDEDSDGTDKSRRTPERRCVSNVVDNRNDRKIYSSSKQKVFRVRKLETSKPLECHRVGINLSFEYPTSAGSPLSSDLKNTELSRKNPEERVCHTYFYGSARISHLKRTSIYKAERSRQFPISDHHNYFQTIDKFAKEALNQQEDKLRDTATCVYFPSRSLRKNARNFKNARSTLSSFVTLEL